jgi:uncharacterized protein YecE (DUF72 family)
MLKPARRVVGTFWFQFANQMAAQHFTKIMWFLSLLAAGVLGWVMG